MPSRYAADLFASGVATGVYKVKRIQALPRYVLYPQLKNGYGVVRERAARSCPLEWTEGTRCPPRYLIAMESR